MSQPNWKKPTEDLRRRVEIELHKRRSFAAAARTEGDTQRLLEELEVHRVQQSLQNEELRAAQLRLTESRDRYRELYDLAPVGHLTLTADGRVREANRTAAKMLNIAPGELLGCNLCSFMTEACADKLQLHLWDACERGNRQACDLFVVPRSHGNLHAQAEVPVRLHTLAVLDGSREKAECRVVIVDVSELHRAEQQRVALDAERHALLDTIPDAVISSDDRGQIESFNDAAERLFGYRPAEVLGQNVSLLMPSPYREEHHGHLRRYREQGQPRIIGRAGRELTGRKKDGTLFPLELGIGEWSADGKRRFTAIIRDLTERKGTEHQNAVLIKQLHHAQKLEAVGALATGVAHDFNNLLMGIMSCSDIALASLPSGSPARMYLGEIKNTSESGAAIVRRLLAFGSRREPETSVFELNKVIGNTVPMLERLLGESVRLDVDLAAQDSRVKSDPGQMEQVLINLAINARDAMPQGGPLRIVTRNPSASQNTTSAQVEVCIQDQGIGMSEATRRRIFEPFFTTRKNNGGTGLGLSTVRGIVQEAGGSILVDSTVNQGTTFIIRLPVAREPITRRLSYPKRQAPRRTGTVMLLEDEHAVRMGTRFYLERAGYRVLEASSGKEAIDCCENFPRPIQLLLTDVALPDISVQEVVRLVNALRPATPILYMSAYPAGWLRRHRRLGQDAHAIQKPFTSDELLSWIDVVLGAAEAGRDTEDLVAGEPAPPSVKASRPNEHQMSPNGEVRPRPPPTAEAPRGPTVLLVEDDPASRLAIRDYLSDLGYHVVTAQNPRRALELCQQTAQPISVLLTDYSLPMISGDALAAQILKMHPEVRVAYMSGHPDMCELKPAGPILTKPINLEMIAETVRGLKSRASDG
jgi:PAS domain S-box-containing protein